jgi:NADH dehydrogenase
MRVVIFGLPSVAAEGIALELARERHEVTLLASDDERTDEWPASVHVVNHAELDPDRLPALLRHADGVVHAALFDGDVSETALELRHLHIARNLLTAAERASCKWFVLLSCLAAREGTSSHRTLRRRAEIMVEGSSLKWLILRSSHVYGPRDPVISALLEMFRSWPAVPVPIGGGPKFQPLWYRDLGRAVASAINGDVFGRTLELAGPDVTTVEDLVSRLEALTGRSPVRLPLPDVLASFAVRIAGRLGLNESTRAERLKLVLEDEVLPKNSGSDLVAVLGVAPTPLESGLRELSRSLPEQLPQGGHGAFEEKRFWASIQAAQLTGPELLLRARQDLNAFFPISVVKDADPTEPGALDRGDTVTMELPGRGQVQVRVLEALPERFTLGTVEGHPLAGTVTFHAFSDASGALRFEIVTHTRHGSLLDHAAMATVGSALQNANWIEVVSHAIAASGGEAPQGVEHEARQLDKGAAAAFESRISALVSEVRKERRTRAASP